MHNRRILNYLSATAAFGILFFTSCSNKAPITSTPIPQEVLEERERFDKFCDDFFIMYLGNNAYNWNVFTQNPSSFGYNPTDDYKATYNTYYEIRKDDYQEAYDYYQSSIALLEAFDYDNLSEKEKISYDAIYYKLSKYAQYYNPENEFDDYIDLDYIDSSGGAVADFDSMIKGYRINSVTDLKNINSYIESTTTAFNSYYTYAVDKVNRNYAISDYTIDCMTSFLDDISIKGEKYYLFDLVEAKIMSSDLDLSVKSSYKELITRNLRQCYLPAVESLSAKLKTLKGSLKAEDEGYYASYGKKAQQMYKFKLETLLGYNDIDVGDYINQLDAGLNDYVTNLNQVIYKYYSLSDENKLIFNQYLNGEKKLSCLTDPDEVLVLLKDYAKTIVPELKTNPSIEFSYMDDAVAKITTTVAYYTKSPIDASSTEFITLNGLYVSNDTDKLVSTICHEGYPGHLYEYVYLKELGLSSFVTASTNTGHGEGWACYTQEKLYDYLASLSNDEVAKIYAEYEKYNFLISYALYARIDVGVNYQGWSVSSLKQYLNDNGYNGGAAESIYKDIIEMPTVYASYGYGSLKMHQYHYKAKKKLKSKYDEIDFNSLIMSKGWQGFETLDKMVEKYISQKK